MAVAWVWPDDRPAIYGSAGVTSGGSYVACRLAAAFTARVLPSTGDISAPVVFKVDRERDGRSFSAHQVAMQMVR